MILYRTNDAVLMKEEGVIRAVDAKALVPTQHDVQVVKCVEMRSRYARHARISHPQRARKFFARYASVAIHLAPFVNLLQCLLQEWWKVKVVLQRTQRRMLIPSTCETR